MRWRNRYEGRSEKKERKRKKGEQEGIAGGDVAAVGGEGGHGYGGGFGVEAYTWGDLLFARKGFARAWTTSWPGHRRGGYRGEGMEKPEVVPPGTAPKRTKSEAAKEFWRKVRAGERPHPQKGPKPARRSVNPLFDLPEKKRAELFAWLRECPYDDAVQHMLRDQGIAEASPEQLNDFFQFEAEQHWEKRIERAAYEANALVQLVERSPARFSSGILAALGQEAFRQIASGQVEPDAMGKLANLFLKARSDERADQMQELKREKLRHELQGQIDHALEKLAEEVDRHPVAREAFEALRKELATSLEEGL